MVKMVIFAVLYFELLCHPYGVVFLHKSMHLILMVNWDNSMACSDDHLSRTIISHAVNTSIHFTEQYCESKGRHQIL